MAYLEPEVSSKPRPEILPDDVIAVVMVEGLVLRVLLCRGPHAHIGNAWRVRLIVYGVVEELVSREVGHLASFLAEGKVEGDREPERHAVSCRIDLM